MARGYTADRTSYLNRLRRVEGQVRGLQAMIEQGPLLHRRAHAECVALGLLQEHLGHCVREAIEAGGPEGDAKVAEASAAVGRLLRS